MSKLETLIPPQELAGTNYAVTDQTPLITAMEKSRSTVLYKISSDPELKTKLSEKKLEVYGSTALAYWETVSDFASEHAEMKHGVLTMDTLALMAATPAFLIASADPDHVHNERESRDIDKFNNLLTSFTLAYPTSKASVINRGLLGMVSNAIEDPAVRQASADTLQKAIHKVQHQNAFGQLLAATGRDYEFVPSNQASRTSIAGVNYTVKARNGEDMQLAVVPSYSSLRRNEDRNGLYTIDGSRVTILSQVTTEELHDSFCIPQSLAQARASYIDALLDRVEEDLYAKPSVLTYSA
jgi:hypothetical protein